MALTNKQRRFVDEYLIDLNATQAAIRSGYSEKTARQIGDRLLTNVDIKQAVQDAMSDLSKRTEITQEQIIKDLEEIKRHAMGKFANSNGEEFMKNYTAAIKAAELQGKHFGMFVEKAEVKHSGVVAVGMSEIDKAL